MLLFSLLSASVFCQNSPTQSGSANSATADEILHNSPAVNLSINFSEKDMAAKDTKMTQTPLFDYLIKNKLFPTTLVSVFNNPYLALKEKDKLPYSIGALTTKLMKDNMANTDGADPDSFILQKGEFVKAWLGEGLGNGDVEPIEQESEAVVVVPQESQSSVAVESSVAPQVDDVETVTG